MPATNEQCLVLLPETAGVMASAGTKYRHKHPYRVKAVQLVQDLQIAGEPITEEPALPDYMHPVGFVDDWLVDDGNGNIGFVRNDEFGKMFVKAGR